MEKRFEVEFRFLAASVVRACVPSELNQASLMLSISDCKNENLVWSYLCFRVRKLSNVISLFQS